MIANTRAALRKKIPAEKRSPIKETGFFDVDSRELSPSGKELVFQDRIKAIAKKLDKLYGLCDKFDIPFVFTICCSGKFLKKDSFDDILYVPVDPDNQEWQKNLDGYRRFYLEKKQYGNPRINSERCAYAFFKYNGNAMKLFKKLKMKKWVVFGNGFDLCVCHACFNLLKNGFKLVILEDAVIPAWGYGPIGTKENKKRILKELEGLGAEIMNTETFFKKYSAS